MASNGEDPEDRTLFYIFRYLIFMGISTHDYDCRTKKLIHKTWAADYCSIFDCFILLICPINLFYTSKFLRSEVFMSRSIALYLSCFLMLAQCSTIIFSRIGNWINRNRTKLFFDELNKIRLNECVSADQNYYKVRGETKKIILLTLLCSCLIMLGTFLIQIQQCKDGMFIDMYWAVGAIFIMMLFVAVENQINFGMIYGTYIFNIINSQLSLIVEEINDLCDKGAMDVLKRKTGLLCYELKKIGKMHTTVLELITDFKNSLKFQIFSNLASIILSQVYYTFTLLVLFSGAYIDAEFQKACALGSILTAFLILWLMVHICGGIVESCNASGEILGSLLSNNLFNKQLETRIQILTLQFLREKMNLSILGLFNLNKATGFLMTEVAVEHLIILMQFDYANFKF